MSLHVEWEFEGTDTEVFSYRCSETIAMQWVEEPAYPLIDEIEGRLDALFLRSEANGKSASDPLSNRIFAAILLSLKGPEMSLPEDFGGNKKFWSVALEPKMSSEEALAKRFADLDIETPREKFNRLKNQWMREMPPSSKLERLFMLMPYQNIIGMGRRVIPLLVEEVKVSPRTWFWALEAITGENPVNPEKDRTIESVGHAWARWAAENGF